MQSQNFPELDFTPFPLFPIPLSPPGGRSKVSWEEEAEQEAPKQEEDVEEELEGRD